MTTILPPLPLTPGRRPPAGTPPQTRRLDQPFRPAPDELAEVARLCRAGTLRRVVGDVALAADLPLSTALRARAIRLLVPTALERIAVVGFGTAAWVHAEWPQDADPEAPLDLVLPPALRRRLAGAGPRLRQMRLADRHVEQIEGLPVCTPARTIADLARDLPPARAAAAMSALHRATGVTVRDVLSCLDQMPRARGGGQARLVVAGWLT